MAIPVTFTESVATTVTDILALHATPVTVGNAAQNFNSAQTDPTSAALSYSQAGVGALNAVQSFLSVMTDTSTAVGAAVAKGGSVLAVSALYLDYLKAEQEWKTNGQISQGTLVSLAADLTAGLGLAGAVVTGGTVALGAGIVASAALGVYALAQPNGAQGALSMAVNDLLGKTNAIAAQSGSEILSQLQQSGGGSLTVGVNNPIVTPAPAYMTVLSSNNNTAVIQRLDKDLQPTETFEVYTVQSGDTLSALDTKYGLPKGTIAKFNPDITNQNVIYAGEQLFVPRAVLDNNQSAAPTGVSVGADQFYMDGAYNDLGTIAAVTGLSVNYLKALNPALSENACYAPGTTVNLLPVGNIPSFNYNDLSYVDKTLNRLLNDGLAGNTLYNGFNDFFSNWLLTPTLTQQIPYVPGYNPADPYGFGPSLNPIGAFYETVTPANDLAPSIADKTPVLLDAANHGMTAAGLAGLDVNHDGQLVGTELGNLKTWADLNENGFLDTGELKTLTQASITQIKSADYGFYTRGNAVSGAGIAAAPARPNEANGLPVALSAATLATASNYRALRDTDNIYIVNLSSLAYITWAARERYGDGVPLRTELQEFFMLILLATIELLQSCVRHVLLWFFATSRPRHGYRLQQPSGDDKHRHSSHKPEWLKHEIIRLKAVMPQAGCRSIADICNRRFAASRKVTVGKTYVHQVLQRHEYEIKILRRKLKHAKPKVVPRNLIWGIDLTGKTDAQGKLHAVFGILDPRACPELSRRSSRALLYLQALQDKTSRTLLACLLEIIRTHGKPKVIRTDNEACPEPVEVAIFTSRIFSEGLKQLGIRHQRTDPGCPWQIGRIERLFGTLKGKLDQWVVAGAGQLNVDLAVFRYWYNHVRPHQNLNGRTPAEAWNGINPYAKSPKHEYRFEAWNGLLAGYCLRD